LHRFAAMTKPGFRPGGWLRRVGPLCALAAWAATLAACTGDLGPDAVHGPAADAAPRAPLGDPLYADFEAAATGVYTQERASLDFGSGAVDYVRGRVAVAAGCATGGQCLRVTYPRGQTGPANGGQFPVDLRPTTEAYLAYDVYFAPVWDWAGTLHAGGKLPGLCGGTCPSGGPDNHPGTSEAKAGEGFSARYMWRADGELVVYLYHQDMPGDFGEDIAVADHLRLPVGRPVRLAQYIRLNTPGVADGVFKVWVDAELVLDRNDLRLMSAPEGSIHRFLFSTFYGGDGDGWGPVLDTHAEFDNFVVSTQGATASAP
jgi:hypothetical protein